MSSCMPVNEPIADALERVAELFEVQRANPFQVRAYRAAAATVRQLDEPVADLLQREGLPGLERLPHVGGHIARAIEQLVRTGRLAMLARLEGDVGAERLLASVPGIGPALAERIHDQLGIETLEELELAAHDGRLEALPGFGPRRVRAVREVLGSLLRRRRFAPGPAAARTSGPKPRPSIAELLAIDAQYRERAARDELPKIAPRRFNPDREAWLPVMHVGDGDRHFTALFSNTALAHKLGTTRDWVVIFHEAPDGDGQYTVVTERRGPLAGRRVVRGREAECERHYRELAQGMAAGGHSASGSP